MIHPFHTVEQLVMVLSAKIVPGPGFVGGTGAAWTDAHVHVELYLDIRHIHPLYKRVVRIRSIRGASKLNQRVAPGETPVVLISD